MSAPYINMNPTAGRIARKSKISTAWLYNRFELMAQMGECITRQRRMIAKLEARVKWLEDQQKGKK